MSHLFQPGNTVTTRLIDEEVFKDAFKAYCAHLAKGKAKKSFYYEDARIPYFGFCGWTCMEETIKKRNNGDDAKHMEVAISKGYALWEQNVENSATGSDKGKSNTASLQMIMRNKYKWDSKEHQVIMANNEVTDVRKDIDGTTKDLVTESTETEPQR